MKAVILAGGLGTRLSEETDLKPKPMVEIGGRPILWHIMKIYSHYGVNDFVVCCGYKGYAIKEYFQNYAIHMSDATFDLGSGLINIHKKRAEDWRVTLVDTGETSMTGGRLKRVREYLDPGETFFFTYGDGVADVDIGKSLKFHKAGQALATMTTVRPPGRFGATLVNSDGYIEAFAEKPKGDGGMVNGGFFVLEPEVIDLIDDDHTVWEQEPLNTLASNGQLRAFSHEGFWQPMDTLRDKNLLERMWVDGKAPWRLWD